MSSPRRSPRLTLQSLETRETPATFGETWLDGRHLTVSFVPDGTSILGTGSSLGSLLSSLYEPSAKFEILKAFQTWAAKTNLNIGVVADLGTPWDAVGAYQGDHRHGDIRIGARPLAGDVVAVASPNGLWSRTAGDIILNSQKTFTVNGAAINKYDLFTTVLQEAGHAFGLGNSSDPASAMHEQYDRALSGLTAADVANIQALYGTRRQDAYEGPLGNNTQATATPITGPIEADLTGTTGTDWYQFAATSPLGTTVRLRASGLSLLTARLEVYDAWGNRMASASTVDPLNNNLTVHVAGALPGTPLYVRVSSARFDVFGVGAYRLTADGLGDHPPVDPSALVDGEFGLNDTLESAVTLARVQDPVARPVSYLTRSALAAAGDVDFFRVQAPVSGGNLVVSVSGVGVANLGAAVTVYTAGGEPVAARIVAESDNHLVLSVSDVSPGADYLIRVSSAAGTAANYDLAAGFRAALPQASGSYGTLAPSAPSTGATMNVFQSQVMHLSLGAYGNATSDATVWVTIFNSQNQVVVRLAVAAGQTDSAAVFLRRGTYRVEVTMAGTDLLASPSYDLRMFGLTDPEGASPTDPTQNVGSGDVLPPPPPSGTTVTITADPAAPPLTTWYS